MKLSHYSAYLHALFKALLRPDDSERHLRARTAFERLPESPCWALTCDYVLGPSPTQFHSDDDWIRYKSGLKNMYDNVDALVDLRAVAESFIDAKAPVRNAWAVLLLPPDQWNYLAEGGLLSNNDVEALRRSHWAKLQEIPKSHVDGMVSVHDAQSAIRLPLPVTPLFKVAVEIHNTGRLMDSSLVREVMSIANVENTDARDLNEVLASISEPSKFNGSWASALMDVCLRVPGVDLQLLAHFWGELNGDIGRSIWFHYGFHSDESAIISVIWGLLNLKSLAALDLAARINSHFPRSPDDLASEINQRAAKMLMDQELNKDQRRVIFRALQLSRPTLLEARLMADETTFRELVLSGISSDRQVAARINALPQLMPKCELVPLRQYLGTIVSSEKSYPPQVRAAALDAIIQIDVACCSPLTEKDWQIEQ